MAHIDATTSEEVQNFLNNNGGIAVIDCHATYSFFLLLDGVDHAK